MTEYHEPWEKQTEEGRNFHRALKSLQEELEAVDWYHQRVTLSQDEPLKQILAHHRDEEIEHACMLIEWLRRKMPKWDEKLRGYLFTEASIIEIEEKMEKAGNGKGGGDLGIGKLRPKAGKEE